MAEFCIVHDLSSPTLWDVMSAGCVPVIYSHHYRLPFDEMIDWSRYLYLLSLMQLLSSEIKIPIKFFFQKRNTPLRSSTS